MLSAHHDAYVHANVFHRDISPGNILITPFDLDNKHEGGRTVGYKGLLVDWEMAERVDMRAQQGHALAKRRVRSEFDYPTHSALNISFSGNIPILVCPRIGLLRQAPICRR